MSAKTRVGWRTLTVAPIGDVHTIGRQDAGWRYWSIDGVPHRATLVGGRAVWQVRVFEAVD